MQDIVKFVDNLNAEDESERCLTKLREKANWLAEQIGDDDLMRIKSGQSVRQAVDTFAKAALTLKAGTTSTRSKSFVDGVEYRMWKSRKTYRGNRHTLATWLVWNAAISHCDEMVEVWCVKKPDQKLKTALGFFCKPNESVE